MESVLGRNRFPCVTWVGETFGPDALPCVPAPT